MEEITSQAPRHLDWWTGVGLSLAALGLYSLTLAPTVLEADAGEFQFVPWIPGIAHPTGYPLYVLAGWGWTHLLPLGEVAWRMNLLSALFGAATVGLLFAVTRQVLDSAMPAVPFPARLSAAAVAAVTFAVTPTFWSQAIIAEVYALHALFVALLLWLTLRLGEAAPAFDRRLASGLAFTFGLALTHHRTIVLLLPAILIYLGWKFSAELNRLSPVALLTGMFKHAFIAALPLLLYLYLPLAATWTPYARLTLSEDQTLTLYDNSLRGFWQHVTGAVFTGELQPTAVNLERVRLTGQLLRQQFGWLGALLAGTGVGVLWLQRRVDLLLLTGLSLLAFVVFNLIYFIGDVFVLFIPVWLIACVWLGLALLFLASYAARWFVRRKSKSPEEAVFGRMKERLAYHGHRLVTTGLTLFFFALPLSLLVTHWPAVDQSRQLSAGQRWQQILAEPLPASAILLSNDRNEIMPMWYYQYVEQRRPDLIGLFPLIVPGPAYANVGRVLEQALASNRPVYLIKAMDGLALKARLEPAGSLYRATAKTDPPQVPLDLQLPPAPAAAPAGQTVTESVRLNGYDLSSARPAPGDVLTVTLHWQAVAPLTVDYTSYLHLMAGDGQRLAQSDHQPGGVYYPSRLWQPGEILFDTHTITIPPAAKPGLYDLIAGMYHQPEPGLFVGMGDGVKIGVITVD